MASTNTPRTVPAYRWRLLPFTIIQGCTVETVKAHSAIGALRQVKLIPGAKVKVWVPEIVHNKRVKKCFG